MRFLVGRTNQSVAPHVYSVTGDNAVDLTALDETVGNDLQAIIAGHSVPDIARATSSIPVSQIIPELPVSSPSKIICLGLNYVDHIKEGGYDIPDYPALFMRGLNSMMPAGAPMLLPECSEQLDYEVELMVIVGRRGKHIPEESALDYVFGYSVFNDGSVREYQRKTHQWTPGKNFDSTGPVGPFVVTPDELPKGASGLKIESRVGDEILQSANTSEMLWPVDKTIATISTYATLEPGDMIAMGTPPGVGHAKTPPRWLRAGETIEVEIEGIGVCANPVVAEGKTN